MTGFAADQVPEPPVSLEVDGRADVPARAGALADLLLEARAGLVEPWWQAGPSRPAERSRGDWGPPGARWSGLHAAAPGAWEGIYEPFTVEGWETQRRQWCAGRLRILALIGQELDADGYPDPYGRGGWQVALDRHLPFAGAAVRLRATVHPGIYDDVTTVLRRRWVPYARMAAEVLEATAGYLTVDHGGGESSPYEQWQGVPIQSVDAARHARGPYWGTLLGPAQLAALGGARAVASRLPEAHVDVVGDAAWVWLPGEPDGGDPDALRRLRDLLGPLLPAGTPGWIYAGLPLRIRELE